MTKTTVKSMYVNGALVRRARMDMKIGLRDFARRAVTTFTIINAIEKDNSISTSTSVAELSRIAHACGLSLAELLTPPASAATPQAPTDDFQALLPILMANPQLTSTTDLARALNWTRERVIDTAKAIDAALQPLGLKLHHYTPAMDRICLRPINPQTRDHIEKLEGMRTTTHGLNVAAARLLRQAVENRLPDQVTHGDKPHVGSLLRQGILRPGAVGEPAHVLTDDAAYAFNVTDCP